jgi:preprotein translocase SecE subunit
MMNKSADDERGGERTERPLAPTPTGGAAAQASGGASALHLYKPGQGAYVRWGSAIGIGIIALGIANGCYEWLADRNLWVQVLVPVLILLVLAYGAFWLLGQYKTVVDFMIATEGEMKKVNWSSRREVLGATKVVIVSVISLGVLLCVVDVLFIFWFETIGVLRTHALGSFFKTQ